MRNHHLLFPAALLALSCARAERAATTVERATPLAVAAGFDGPEGVRYDPDQNVFFVSNFAGDGDALDTNGFISRLRADGTVDSLRFIQGGRGGVILHGPRGMAIHGDTLWVADADAVRGFDRRTGAPLRSFDFTPLQPGFLNDVTVGGDNTLWITDTGRRHIYRIAAGVIETALSDTALGGPNGITWDRAGLRFFIAPYFEGQGLLQWQPGGVISTMALGVGGRYDGVEVIGPDSVLVASQTDSTIHLFTAGRGRPLLKLAGRPADIGWNASARVVAVPYVSRDTVEFFRIN